MKLIKQTQLAFQAGNSDKVYEIDLCEVGTEQFVVNFRYGKRGKALTEGSKTPLPVDKKKAEQLFTALVTEKTKKGYIELSSGAETTAAVVAPEVAIEQPEKTIEIDTLPVAYQHVLYTLNQHYQQLFPTARIKLSQVVGKLLKTILPAALTTEKTASKQWKLDRVLWKVAEWRIAAAEPYLLVLLQHALTQRDKESPVLYSLVYAIGRCRITTAYAHLEQLYHQELPTPLRRLVLTVLLEFADETQRKTLETPLINSLPNPVKQALLQADENGLKTAIDTVVADKTHITALFTLYQLNRVIARPALLTHLQTMNTRPPFFRIMRHIFKIAEYRDDIEFFSLLAFRFETASPTFRKGYWGAYIQFENGKYQWLSDDALLEQLQSPTAKIANSNYTHFYLKRRIWRKLHNLGEINSPLYVEFATAFLQHFSDSHAKSEKRGVGKRLRAGENLRWWERYETYPVFWSNFGSYWALNHILHKNSTRLEAGQNTWRWRENCPPTTEMVAEREEAYPDLWTHAPQQALHLLLVSQCSIVHQFALKVLQSTPEFTATIPLEQLQSLLKTSYTHTQQFALRLAIQNHADKLSLEFLTHALLIGDAETRRHLQNFLQKQRDKLLQDGQYLVQLALSSYEDNHEFVQQLLRGSHFETEQAHVLVGRFIAQLLVCNDTQSAQAQVLIKCLQVGLATYLPALQLSVLQDLLAHSLMEIQAFASDLLGNYSLNQLPESVLYRLLDSPFAVVQVVGLRLLQALNNEELSQRLDLLTVLATHSRLEIREGSRPLLQRVLQHNALLGNTLLQNLLSRLMSSKLAEGVHSALFELINSEFAVYLNSLSADITWRLLRAKPAQAQQLGGILLNRVPTEQFSVKQLVVLADHEILSIRQSACQLCGQIMPRLQQDMATTIKLLDSRWDETRQFGFQLLNNTDSTYLTPEVLVSVCDSVKEDVQQFGRHLLTRHFEQENGHEYLLKLSEHPSTAMQLFATNYLERYAANHLQRLQQLKPYFLRLLCNVNKGRIAKQRTWAFLKQQAQLSPEIAQLVAEIASRQSLTIAVGDKAAAIKAMATIQRQFKDIEMPCVVQVPRLAS